MKCSSGEFLSSSDGPKTQPLCFVIPASLERKRHCSENGEMGTSVKVMVMKCTDPFNRYLKSTAMEVEVMDERMSPLLTLDAL